MPDETDGGEEGQVDFDKERARLMKKPKEKLVELKLAQMQHKAYSAKTVEYVLTEMLFLQFRTQLLGLLPKCPIMEGKSKDEIYKLLTHEIEDKLTEKLKQYSDAQGELASAFSKLMVVAEKYPELKAMG